MIHNNNVNMKKIHYHSACPFSRTIIMLASELKLNYQLIEEKNLFEGIIHHGNIFNKLPILNDNEICIYSQYSISEYLIEKYATLPQFDYILGTNAVLRAKTRELLDFINQKFYNDVTKILIYEKILKNYHLKESNRSPDSNKIRHAESNLKDYLFHFQEILKLHEFCASEIISLADFSLASHLSILDYLNNIPWSSGLAKLKNWYSVMKSRPNFKTLLSLKIIGFHPSENYTMVDL